MENELEIDLENAGFDTENPGQYCIARGDVVFLRLCYTKSKASSLSHRIYEWAGAPTVYFDPKQPSLVLLEWQVSPEQAEQARVTLKPLSIREVDLGA